MPAGMDRSGEVELTCRSRGRTMSLRAGTDREGFGSRNWAGSDLDLRKSVFFYRIQHRWVEGR